MHVKQMFSQSSMQFRTDLVPYFYIDQFPGLSILGYLKYPD